MYRHGIYRNPSLNMPSVSTNLELARSDIETETSGGHAVTWNYNDLIVFLENIA